MPPGHGTLKVRHAVAQGAPQKQKLGLLRQGKGLALINQRNNLPGSIGELSLNIVVRANRHSDNGQAIPTMCHPQRLGQCSNRLLIVGHTPPTEDARLVMAHVEANLAQAVGPVAVQDLKDSLHVPRVPHCRDIIKICDGGGLRNSLCKVV